MYRSPALDVVPCPLCDEANPISARECKHCHQALHDPLDRDALHAEHRAYKARLALTTAATGAMLGLNFLIGQMGAFFIFLAPVGWLLSGWRRFRAIGRWLAKKPTP
jgi:hypothetical protein